MTNAALHYHVYKKNVMSLMGLLQTTNKQTLFPIKHHIINALSAVQWNTHI